MCFSSPALVLLRFPLGFFSFACWRASLAAAPVAAQHCWACSIRSVSAATAVSACSPAAASTSGERGAVESRWLCCSDASSLAMVQSSCVFRRLASRDCCFCKEAWPTLASLCQTNICVPPVWAVGPEFGTTACCAAGEVRSSWPASESSSVP